jgi:hypothetical protein
MIRFGCAFAGFSNGVFHVKRAIRGDATFHVKLSAFAADASQ